MKIVINRCWGGFSISLEAARWMAERGHAVAAQEVKDWEEEGGKFYGYGHVDGGDGYQRNDPLLAECVETLGKSASGSMAELAVVEIPDGIEWYIHNYDGMESVEEAHRSWR